MTIIPAFNGNQFNPGTASYVRANQTYSTSTYGAERSLKPGEILQPTSVDDICDVVKWAGQQNPPVPIAIKTGGHQYSGACSTGETGIQLDLKPTFRSPKVDLHLIRDTVNDKVYIKSSVSWTLTEFYDFLQDNGVFLPTGQCATVCLGGHVQTGGYGMLARSFGVLGDYIKELDIVDFKGDKQTITQESHPDLFFGFLGGSPGNLGVLTHIKVEVQDDQKHKGSKGLWVAFKYSKKTIDYLLNLLVEKGQDPNFKRNFDFTVNIVDRAINLLDMFPGSESELRDLLPDKLVSTDQEPADLIKFRYSLIVVYAQWVNFGDEPYDSSLFDSIYKAPYDLIRLPKESGPDWGMSKIMAMWLFSGDREYPYPYVKRTNLTYSKTLREDKFAEWFSGRIDGVVSDRFNGLWLSSQLQVYGGDNSMFSKNANNGTAYSWRNATIVGTWDVFYSSTRAKAEAWQDQNDEEAVTHFSKEQLRLLWGSYGDWDMKKPEVWQRYYDAETYQKLQHIRSTWDPQGVFTANPFCVEKAKV